MAIAPGLSGELQITIFAVLSIALTFAGRWAIHQYGDGGESHDTLNQRSKHLVGRTAKVLDFDAGSSSGAVEVEGMRWRATWPSGQTSNTGETVRIRSADGMNLTVEPTA